MSSPAAGIDRYAVIGQPVAHSLSPRIHQQFAAQSSDRLVYEAIEVTADELPVTLHALHGEGYRGLNVTLPHKQAVAGLCHSVSERASLAGAVNTLIAEPEGWRGDNTDGEGLIRDLQRLGIEPGDRRVLLIGAGGAARGILGPLLALGPRELVLSNRNPWKPEALAEAFRGLGRLRPCTHLALKGDRFDLVINATSAGHEGRAPRLPDGLIDRAGVAYDLSYGPAHAPFKAWALAQGAATVHDGLGMLVEQAGAAYQLWRGRKPGVSPVISALRDEGR